MDRLQQKSYELDLDLDHFAEKIKEEYHTEELVRHMIYLSQYMENKLAILTCVPVIKLARDRWFSQVSINSGVGTSEEKIFDLNCSGPIQIVYAKAHLNRLRTQQQAQELAIMISNASILKDVLILFNRHFSIGPSVLVAKTIDVYHWLTRSDKTLQIILQGLVGSLRDKKEQYFHLCCTLQEKRDIEAEFVDYELHTDMSFLYKYDEFLSEENFAPESTLLNTHKHIMRRRDSAPPKEDTILRLDHLQTPQKNSRTEV